MNALIWSPLAAFLFMCQWVALILRKFCPKVIDRKLQRFCHPVGFWGQQKKPERADTREPRVLLQFLTLKPERVNAVFKVTTHRLSDG